MPRSDDPSSHNDGDADFRFHAFAKGRTFGLIVMSNFLHAYGEKEARRLLEKALCLLKPGGKGSFASSTPRQ